MRRTRLERFLTSAMAVAITAVAFLPASAVAAPVDDARNQIWAIVQAADAYNQTVLNQFASAASSATTVGELDAAYSSGYNALEARWYQANAQIDAIVADFPELQSVAAQAKAELLDDHNGAHWEMDSLYDLIRDNLTDPTTTTTTSTSTSTTTVPGTTSTSTSTTSTTSTSTSTTSTTVPRSTTTSTTDPRTTTTTDAPSSTTSTSVTSTTVRDTTTTTDAGAVGIGDPGSGAGDATPARVADDPATTSDPTFGSDGTAEGAAMDDAMAASMQDSAPAMAMIVETASIVLPPGLVEMAARPLIAIEFIVRTFFDSVGAMVLPFLTLMAAVAFMLWRESRRVRTVAG